MAGRYLLDTNVIIALFADEPTAKDNLAKAGEVFVPVITVGELCFGAWKSGRRAENLAHIEDFVSSSVVLGCDADTARRYGEIKNGLRLKGRPVPENDIWIAALAFQYHLALATRDEHFNEIDGLEMAIW